MGEWFLGEVRIFPFQTVPAGWLQCQGQLLPINQYQALYSLLGVQFGGDGKNTFALPDLRGRVGVSQGVSTTGTGYPMGQAGGAQSVALTIAQLPTHTHDFQGTGVNATTDKPPGALLANATNGVLAYKPYNPATQTTLTSGSIAAAGQNVAHENRQPYLALNICIASQGFYPQRS